MYHIKQDKRTLHSAEEITAGLYRCLETMPLHAITVSDLFRETGISRATIYRLFDTPEDILIYQIDKRMKWIYDYHEAHTDEPPEKVFEAVLTHGLENHLLMEALVKNGRFDILHTYTERSFHIFDELFSTFPLKMDTVESDYVLSCLAMNMVATLSTWIKRGRVESAEQLVQYTKQFLHMLQYITEGSS